MDAFAALAWRFHGDAIADELQIPRDRAVDAVIGKAIEVNNRRRQSIRQKPDEWGAALNANMEAARQAIAERHGALYETEA
ncbi:hypothetical protein ACI3KW_00870 [Devosia sp. ZW T5_3]|uniref:hypothetical protein n=1 Tax=Devosia sp. ZW T5_3 TaxID=3378085 RepID=UPI00385313EB